MKYCNMCKRDLPKIEFKRKTNGNYQKGCIDCLIAYTDKYKQQRKIFENDKYMEDDGSAFVDFHENRVKDIRRDYYGGCSSNGIHDSGGK